MTSYDLTGNQKELLTLLVKSVKSKKIAEPIIPEIKANSCSIDGLDVKFGRNFVWDMEALCEADLMACTYSRYSSQGNRIYTITRAGYQAVTNNFVFVIPEEPEAAADDTGPLGDIDLETIQKLWFENLAEMQQVVNDRDLLKETLEALTGQLLEVVEADLSAYKLTSYKRDVRELTAQILADQPSPGTLQGLFASLSFMDSIGGSLPLAEKAYPYLYPLLVLANHKLSQE